MTTVTWDKLYRGFHGDDLIRVFAADMINRTEAISIRLDILEKATMTTLDDVQAKASTTLAAVQADTAIDSAVAKVVDDQNAKLTDLKTQLDALIASGGGDPVKLQTLSDTIDAILQSDTSNAAIVSAAVTAGTPVVPAG